MKHFNTLLASTALALVIGAGSAFAGPSATVNDNGIGNVDVITQASGSNAATTADIEQGIGTSGNVATILQNGSGKNVGTVTETTGASNVAYIKQVNAGASTDTATVTQNSGFNTATVYQNGTGDTTTVTQTGGTSSAHANLAQVYQGANPSTVQSTNNGSVTVDQNGNTNYAYVNNNDPKPKKDDSGYLYLKM